MKINDYPFKLGINTGLGLSLSLFPFIYEKIRSRRINKTNLLIEKNKNIKDPYLEKFNKIKHYKYYFILFASFLDFFQKFLYFYFHEVIINNFWTFDILFINLFSFFILKSKLYIHQYFSLISIIILGIILITVYLYDENVKFISIVLVLSIEIIFSFNIVINKYSMNKYFCSPFEICFYQGLFAIIMNIILLIITKKDNIKDYYKELNSTETKIFFLLLFSRLSFTLFGLVTVKYFTPSHEVLLLIIGEIFLFYKYSEGWKIYVNITIFLLLLIMIFIFTEIIEINLCNLQKNTKRNISERSMTQSDIPIFDGDDNTSEDRDSLVEIEGYEVEMKLDKKKG